MPIRNILLQILVGVNMVLTARPVLAHHSFSAEYDADKPIKVTGSISKVEWTNPHIWFYVEVKDARGSVTTWAFSGGAPGMLLRRGITKEVLKIGMVVTVEGSQAKDGSNNAYGQKVTLPDGRTNVF